jgi:alanine-glyoxylate transaminase / serine-glyoxylate transaminase / serine-pyruvate transaminase
MIDMCYAIKKSFLYSSKQKGSISMQNDALKLMIPGPIQPDRLVLNAMSDDVCAHYGPAWVQFYAETLNLLRKVYKIHGDVFIMPGSGSLGLDTCIGSALSSGEKCLVGNNGFFGERLTSIAASYGLEVVPVRADWGQPLRAEDFEDAFQRHPDARAAVVVHLETSTTIVNPIEEIGQVCVKNGALFMVDAVSSLGGMPLDMDHWNIDLCASASQKCLGAPPGLATVAVSPKAWEAIDRNPAKQHGWFTDLRVWRKYAVDWGDWHPSPVTMPVNNVRALRLSLEQLLAEGIENRLERYRCLALHLREGLRRLNMPPYTPDEIMAPVLTAAYGLERIPTCEIVSFLEEKHHIKISGGLGALKDRVFRIGHMSPILTESDIDQVLAALADFRKEYIVTAEPCESREVN